MNRRIRRTFVASGVVASLLAGAVSIRFAADMTAAAAPPPAPPVSLESLKSALAAEQARGTVLQAQLDDLLAVTDELTTALSSTAGEVKIDGLTAKQLRERLKAADAKLKALNRLLKEAQRRLTAAGIAVPTAAPTKSAGGGSSGGGGGTTASPPPTPAPTPRPATLTLTVELASGGVLASWSACSSSGFNSFALVRSSDSEIHYPPEDGDTLVARIANIDARSTVDAAPSGSSWYRLYCLARFDGETRTAATSTTQKIIVP